MIGLGGAVPLVIVWVLFWAVDRYVWRLPTAAAAVIAGVWMGEAVAQLVRGNHASAIPWAAISGWLAWLAWTRRPPRRRRPSRVAGWIRDLGHRLVVGS